MSKGLLRILIIITGGITALVHLFLGIADLGSSLGPAFILNGLMYLALVVAVTFTPGFLQGRERFFHYLLMGFAGLTIVLWYYFNQGEPEMLTSPMALFTKLDEVLLIIFTFLHLRASE